MTKSDNMNIEVHRSILLSQTQQDKQQSFSGKKGGTSPLGPINCKDFDQIGCLQLAEDLKKTEGLHDKRELTTAGLNITPEHTQCWAMSVGYRRVLTNDADIKSTPEHQWCSSLSST